MIIKFSDVYQLLLEIRQSKDCNGSNVMHIALDPVPKLLLCGGSKFNVYFF